MMTRQSHQIHWFSMRLRSVALLLSVIVLLLSIPSSTLAENAPDIELTQEEQAWLAQHPDIVLGTAASYPPMVIKNADGTHIGVLVDIFEQISRYLNTGIRLHIEDSWADVQEKAQNREIDGLAFGGRDSSRDALYNPTDIVLHTYFSVFARSQNEYRLKSFSDLDGMRIGHKGAARPTKSLLEKLPSAILKPYDSHEAMTQALLTKEVDVLVAWMSYDHWRKEKLQGTIDNILLIDEYPIEMVTYVRKDWPELTPILNKALAALQQEELPHIINKWFGQWPRSSTAERVPLTSEDRALLENHPDLAPLAFKIRERVQLNAEERKWLQTKTRVPVRVGDYPPFFFVADGSSQGVSIDYVQLVCMAHNLDCDYVTGLTIAESISSMQKPGGIAIQPGWQKNPEREKLALFTGTNVVSPFVIFQREDSERVHSMEDLAGKLVVVEKNYAIHSLLKRHFPELQLIEVDCSTEALKELAEGRADAYVSSLMAGYYISLAQGFPNIVVAAPAPFEPNSLEIAVRKDWPELASIITKSIAAIQPEERQNIHKRWLSVKYNERIDYTLLLQVLVGACFVFLAIVYWNKQLSRKVKIRTFELSESESRFRATFEQAAVGIAHVAPDGSFLRLNEKFCEIVGYSQEEMVSKTFQEITHPDDLDKDLDLLQQLLYGRNDSYTLEKRYIRKDSSIVWINLTVKILRNSDKTPKWFVSVIEDISERKQAEQKLLDYQQRLKAQATQLTIVEEQERRRIATDLHDNVGQTLALSRLQLAAASKSVDDAALKEQFDELSQTLLSAVKDTRHLIFELSSPTLYELGLGAAIGEWIEHKLKPDHSLDVELVDKLKLSCLSLDQNTVLFRSVRELLTNIVKYARADKASVLLEQEGNVVRIKIKDNGIGFNPEQVKRNVSSEGGLGLFSIEERLTAFGGSMVIDSKVHHGTTIVLTVPCSETTKETT